MLGPTVNALEGWTCLSTDKLSVLLPPVFPSHRLLPFHLQAVIPPITGKLQPESPPPKPQWAAIASAGFTYKTSDPESVSNLLFFSIYVQH
jgi:hypothetical protein